MNTVTEQSLYSLRATAEDCNDAGEADRAALLRACEATLSEELNRRDIEIARLRFALEHVLPLAKGEWAHHENLSNMGRTVGAEALRVIREALTPNVQGEG